MGSWGRRKEKEEGDLGEVGCCRLESRASGEWVILGAKAGPQGSPMIFIQEGVLGSRGTTRAVKCCAVPGPNEA